MSQYCLCRTAPSLLELPLSTFEAMCLSLDSGTVHSWRSLVDHLADYTIMDVRQLNVVQQKASSFLCESVLGWGNFACFPSEKSLCYAQYYCAPIPKWGSTCFNAKKLVWMGDMRLASLLHVTSPSTCGGEMEQYRLQGRSFVVS